MKRKQLAVEATAGPSPKRSKAGRSIIFEKLSEELCFHCMSYLGYADLLALSETTKYLSRLANDNQLWKALYTREYLDQEQDDAWFKRDDSLPTKTWKDLFRIAHNWKVGKARTTRLPLRSAVLPKISLSTEINDLLDEQLGVASSAGAIIAAPSTAFQARTRQQEHAKVVWHGQHYFIASEDVQEGGLPSIDVFRIEPTSQTSHKVASIASKALKGKGHPGSLSVTELQLDAAAATGNMDGIRLVVFYSNGQYSLFRIKNTGPTSVTTDITFTEEYFSSQTSSRPTIMARLHSPILVTSSSDLSVRFRIVEERHDSDTGASVVHVVTSPSTMYTTLCFAPMSMRLIRREDPSSGFAKLKAEQSPQRFQLSLAYSTPYYPAAFTVGIQVFNITVPVNSKRTPARRRSLEIFARSAIAVPPSSELSTGTSQAIVNTIEHDGPYIVASKSDNTISVYRVVDCLSDSWLSSVQTANSVPLSPVKLNAIPLQLRHIRTLFGHTAAVDAVGLMKGRCVSTGRDGIKVWELPQTKPSMRPLYSSENSDSEEEDYRWKVNIAISEREDQASKEVSTVASLNSPGKCQWIGLDPSRIVTVCQDHNAAGKLMKVYHFE